MDSYYKGCVTHSRLKPSINAFTYNYYMIMKKINQNSATPEYYDMVSLLVKSNYTIKEYFKECDVHWLSEPGIFGKHFNPISFWYFIKDNIIQTILVTVTNSFNHFNANHAIILFWMRIYKRSIIFSYDIGVVIFQN